MAAGGRSLAPVLHKAGNLFILQQIASQRHCFWRCAFSISLPIKRPPRGFPGVVLSQQGFFQTSVNITGWRFGNKISNLQVGFCPGKSLRFSCDDGQYIKKKDPNTPLMTLCAISQGEVCDHCGITIC